ncbi:MAG: BamA/TamA family outer membrane protein [Fibrobacteria bacterium]|nr:BamA/TamA family outer membrane protein [Fibrobacteria bacterium]
MRRLYLKLTLIVFQIGYLTLSVPGYTHSDNISGFEGKNIRSIQIKGLSHTKPWIVYRELLTKQGNLYQDATFQFDIKALEKLDIFADVSPEITEKEGQLEIILLVKELPPFIPHPTAEVTEENGLSFGGGILGTNLWGRNHYIEGTYKTGLHQKAVKRLSLEYSIPRILHKRVEMRLWLADERRKNVLEEFREDPYQVARLQLFPTLMYTESFRLKAGFESCMEWFQADRDSITLSPQNRDFLPSVGVSVIFDSRDYAGNPTKGFFGELGIFNFGGLLGGPSDFLQTIADFRIYQPLTGRQHILLSQLLTLQSGSLNNTLPRYRRFWLGGANSVRGFELDEQRGANQALFTLEYRFLLMKPRVIPLFLFDWYLDLGLQPIVAVDAGTTWDNFSDKKQWLGSIITGAQILVPYIQMIRLEWGIVPYWHDDRLSISFHFSAIDKPTAQRFRRR